MFDTCSIAASYVHPGIDVIGSQGANWFLVNANLSKVRDLMP